MLLHNKKWLFAAAASLVLAACGSSNREMYNWGNGAYADSMYQTMLHEGDPQEQIQKLESLSQQGKAAPGLYAQLGLLYSEVGDSGKAASAFNKEAELYPESKPYMQFVLNKGKLPAAASAAPAKAAKTKKGASK